MRQWIVSSEYALIFTKDKQRYAKQRYDKQRDCLFELPAVLSQNVCSLSEKEILLTQKSSHSAHVGWQSLQIVFFFDLQSLVREEFHWQTSSLTVNQKVINSAIPSPHCPSDVQ